MESIFIKNQIILFQGDSITDCGRRKEMFFPMGEGYPAKIATIYKELYPNTPVQFVNRGISGDRVCDILERYQEDIKDVQPDFISLLVGINDVWRRYDENNPMSLEDFTKYYKQLLQQLKEDFSQVPIIMIEPFLIPTDPLKDKWHEDLDPKIQVVRKLATEYATYYLAMDGIFASLVASKTHQASELSLDGVHPTSLGHSVIATSWMELVGLL